jgi:hypothetical protein
MMYGFVSVRKKKRRGVHKQREKSVLNFFLILINIFLDSSMTYKLGASTSGVCFINVYISQFKLITWIII